MAPWRALYLLLFFIIVCPLLFYFYFNLSFYPEELATKYPHFSFSSPQQEFPTFTIKSERPKNWVNWGQVSAHLRWSIILSEDWSFFDHEGFDSEQFLKVLRESWEKKTLTRGASTISQQLIKNVYLNHERSLFRKFKEFILTPRLEKSVPKIRIFECYINVIEFGKNVWGLSQASQYYFKKIPSQLNPKEAAFLAMLLPNPKKYSASFYRKKLSPFAQKRIADILQKLKWAKLLNDQEALYWTKIPLSFEK
jgi:monofunctional biosynthetic peptidoglycan transglycosylase